MFLDPRLVRAANRHVHNGPADKNPVFRRTAAGLVEISGGILRYSTTTPEAKTK